MEVFIHLNSFCYSHILPSHLELQPTSEIEEPIPESIVSTSNVDVSPLAARNSCMSIPTVSNTNLRNSVASTSFSQPSRPQSKSNVSLRKMQKFSLDSSSCASFAMLGDNSHQHSPAQDTGSLGLGGNISLGISGLQSAAANSSRFQPSDSGSLGTFGKDSSEKPNMILRKRISAMVHPTKEIASTAFAENRHTNLPNATAFTYERSRRPLQRNLSKERNYDSIEHSNLSSNNSSIGSLPSSPGIGLKKTNMGISDLDIQLANPHFDFDKTLDPGGESERFNHYVRRKGRKDLISNTVDMWARQSSLDENSTLTKSHPENAFKPLIFGGTFPIDSPASPPQNNNQTPSIIVSKEDLNSTDNSSVSSMDTQHALLKQTIEKSLDNFEKALAKRQRDLEIQRREFSAKKITKTFNIDEPITFKQTFGDNLEPKMGQRIKVKRTVAVPKTFSIDEPV